MEREILCFKGFDRDVRGLHGQDVEAAELQIEVLGPLSVRRGGDARSLPQSKKTRGLLAYLALTGRSHRRDRLCSLLWDVADDPRGALRWSLSKIRPLVNGDDRTRLVADRSSVRLEVEEGCIDLVRVRQKLDAGEHALTVEELEALAGCFRGELLEGLDLSDFHEFAAWCAAERKQARDLHARVLGALVDRLDHDPERAVDAARELVRIDPLDEAARARLIRLLARAGHRDEAEVTYESGKRLLSELGAKPAGALAAAWAEIRERGPAPAPRASRPAITLQPPLTTDGSLFIGRDDERALLQNLLGDVGRRNRLRAFLLGGEPGVGKTRLLADFVEHARSLGCPILHGTAFEAETGRPYGPWIDALRALPPGVITPELSAGLSPLLPELATDDAEEGTRDRLFGSVVDLISDHARTDAPTVLLLDDVHWSDDATAELLHYVARMCKHRPVAIVLAARDGELVDCEPMMRVLRGFRRDRILSEHTLLPLGQQDIAELVRGVDERVDAASIFEQSGGNPLLAIELARSGDDSASLRELVKSRLSHLPDDAADVLRWGAILGATFEVERLTDLGSLDLDELVSALEQVERHGLLRGADGLGSRYAFPHDLVRRVIYDELSEPRRRLMHLKAAKVLDALPDADGSIAVEVAHHAHLAGDATMAARACVAAGARCIRVFANAEAHAHARRGLRYVDEIPDPERLRLKIELLQLSVTSRRPEDLAETCREIEALAEEALDAGCPKHARLAFHVVSHLRWDEGDVDAARRFSLRAERASRGSADRDRVHGIAEAARCLVILERDLVEAEALLLEARAVVDRTGQTSFAVSDGVGLLRFHGGELDAAADRFHEARSLARMSGARLMEFSALEHLVTVELVRGAYDRAASYCDDLLEIGSRVREGSEEPVARALSAISRYGAGDESAVGPLDEALERLRIVDAKQRLAFALVQAGRVDIERGYLDRGVERAEEALRMAEILDRPSETAMAHCLLARAALGRGDLDAAAAHRRALGRVRGYAAWVRAEIELTGEDGP